MQRRGATQQWLIRAAAACLMGACATPTEQAGRFARAAGFEPIVLQGEGFHHWSQYRAGRGGRRLHVYVDHDGSPWLAGEFVAADPTPREPVALRLMARDPGPALYVGRPCHFEVDGPPRCQPLQWTHERYGERLVASMARAVQEFAAARGFDEFVLIGHSGGGAIVMLMAPRLSQTRAVVTIAGNLDVAAWSRAHGFSPLTGSLNPAMGAPLPSAITQLHYVGSEDRNVTPAMVRGYAERDPGARVVEVPGFDHRCCWEAEWPRFLCRPPLQDSTACHN